MISIGNPSASFASARNVLGHAQRVGADYAHRLRRKAAQAVGETPQRVQCAHLGGAVDALVAGQTRAEAHLLAQAVEQIDLIIDDTADLQVKAVGAQIDRGKRLVLHGGITLALGPWRRNEKNRTGAPKRILRSTSTALRLIPVSGLLRPAQDLTACSISSALRWRTSLPLIM
jgi:hypothetical protein